MLGFLNIPRNFYIAVDNGPGQTIINTPTTTMEDVIKYISDTPNNTNPSILRKLMSECGIENIEEKIAYIMDDPDKANYNVWKDLDEYVDFDRLNTNLNDGKPTLPVLNPLDNGSDAPTR